MVFRTVVEIATSYESTDAKRLITEASAGRSGASQMGR